MADLSWYDAVHKVLKDRNAPMHYTEIAEEIATTGLRENLGATPATSVNVAISNSFKQEKSRSPFVRIDRGIYSLKAVEEIRGSQEPSVATEEEEDAGFINALGMFWARSEILWTPTAPKLLGQQQAGSNLIDFSGQVGVYLLYDRREVIYVGRTTDQNLGARLRQHTFDRLSSRWDRFSWFGVFSVNESGALDTSRTVRFDQDSLIATMEALLIEGLEPLQNRQRGAGFRAVEFLQATDPDLQKKRDQEAVARLTGTR